MDAFGSHVPGDQKGGRGAGRGEDTGRSYPRRDSRDPKNVKTPLPTQGNGVLLLAFGICRREAHHLCSLKRSTAVLPALTAAVIGSIGGIGVIFFQIMGAQETITITQLAVNGGDVAAKQPGDLSFAVTGTKQGLQLHTAVVIKPFPSCHIHPPKPKAQIAAGATPDEI